ncbi:MAG: hypothetical protein IH597_02425 [Bacteroidales bacterium]|nr:hypothetical protein [Bacteroidales bacterium]
MYFINKYRSGMPFLKKVLEDTRYRIRWIRNYYRNGKKIRTVLFYPHFPSKSTVLYKIFKGLHYNITNNPDKLRSLTIYWEDVTIRNRNAVIEKISKSEKVINIKSLDISKSTVDKYFTEVFGYSSLVDPANYSGLMVQKSEINASHDGKIVQGPVHRKQGYVYQKLINNQFDSNFVADIRIPFINGAIPMVFIKYKTISSRFGVFRKWHHKLKNVEVHPPESSLSSEEILKLKEFCHRFKLDYGELDVLRDRDDGKIYIVDVNNTPTGPPYMDRKKQEEAIRIMTRVFRKDFLERN